MFQEQLIKLGGDPNNFPAGFQNVYYASNNRLRNHYSVLPSAHPSVGSRNSLSDNYFYNDDFFNSVVNMRNYFNMMLIRNMYKKKIEVNTFQLDDDNFVIIDRFLSKVSIYSKGGTLKSEKHFDFENKVLEIKQDPYSREIYFTSKTENLFKVHRLNIEDGSTHYVGGFKNIMLARTIKIFDGWIYYRVKKNDYYKLYRTRLRS